MQLFYFHMPIAYENVQKCGIHSWRRKLCGSAWAMLCFHMWKFEYENVVGFSFSCDESKSLVKRSTSLVALFYFHILFTKYSVHKFTFHK